MEYKILEANGVENENVDGAAFNNFSSKGKNGIIRGILNECDVHLLNSSTVEISSGELLIQGFRIKIIEPYTAKRDASASSISHQLIARIRLSSDRSVSFEIECRAVAPLQQDSLFKNELGIYEVEIATFKTDQNGISNLSRTLSIIDSRAELGTSGGRTGQVLKKRSDLDYDYGWEDEDTSLYTSLSSEISENRKRITNLELGLPEDRFQTDASTAYVKNVPLKALPYAAISNVGGMTYRDGDVLKSAPVTEVKSVGANGIIGTLTIPEAVQVLEGYGDGINTAYTNVVDYDKRKYTQWVRRLSQSEKTLTLSDYAYNNVVYYQIPKAGTADSGTANTNILVSNFPVNSVSGDWDSADRVGTVTGAATYSQYWFGFPVGTTLEQAQAVIDNADILVTLPSAEITDISDILPADNLLEVEGGGTITMVNEYGYAVPSKVIYQMKEVAG